MSGARPAAELPPIEAPRELLARTPLPEVVELPPAFGWQTWDDVQRELDGAVA